MARSWYLRAAAMAAALLVISGCGKKTGGAQAFEGARAFELLKKQCSFGPRYAGTRGHAAAADFIRSELKSLADEVTTHTFKRSVRGKPLEFENIYAVFNPDASRFVLLCAHWDTRPTADEEVDPEKRSKPIIGANDGASGVAVLLELARVFHEKKPQVGVVMAFFDGEDYGPGSRDMYIGSREFAQNWKKPLESEIRNPKSEIEYGILLDMVGDADLQLPKEQRSVVYAPEVVEKVWAAARRAGYGSVFLDEAGYDVEDDHLPLNKAGIKCIDIIDFNYAYWHTLDDTVDKCSPKSLQIVGNVIEKVIYGEKGAPAK